MEKNTKATEVMQVMQGDGPSFVSQLVPVVEIIDAEDAVPLARALLEGGIDVIEITLRSEAALKAIENIAQSGLPIALAAGTVLNIEQLLQVKAAGAKFAFSPGSTPALLDAARQHDFGFIPGVASASEVMQCLEKGFTLMKLFPADIAGGISFINAVKSPLPMARFIPTGGVNASNAASFAACSNVAAMGGSWLAPKGLIQAKAWPAITQLALQARELI